MKLSLIVAMASNRTIGLDNKMPWHLSADLKKFKKLLWGSPLLWGAKLLNLSADLCPVDKILLSVVIPIINNQAAWCLNGFG
jgi:dihydrofolate reductase (EC 1.5.1.3)